MLVQSAVNVVEGVPLGGSRVAEHVGGTATVTVLELHEFVWPPAVAVSVTQCEPRGSVLEVEPVQATAPWFTPSRAQVQDVASLVQLAVNVVVVPPVGGFIVAEQVGLTVTVFESQLVVPPGPVAVSVSVWLPAASRLEVTPLQATLP